MDKKYIEYDSLIVKLIAREYGEKKCGDDNA